MIADKGDLVHRIPDASINLKAEDRLPVLLFGARLYIYVEVAFTLKVIRKVPPALLDDVGIDRAFVVDGNQPALPAAGLEGNPGKPGSHHPDFNGRTGFHMDGDIGE